MASKPPKDLRSRLISSMTALLQARPSGVQAADDAGGKSEQQHDQHDAQHERPVLGVGSDQQVQQGQRGGADTGPQKWPLPPRMTMIRTSADLDQ